MLCKTQHYAMFLPPRLVVYMNWQAFGGWGVESSDGGEERDGMQRSGILLVT